MRIHAGKVLLATEGSSRWDGTATYQLKLAVGPVLTLKLGQSLSGRHFLTDLVVSMGLKLVESE